MHLSSSVFFFYNIYFTNKLIIRLNNQSTRGKLHRVGKQFSLFFSATSFSQITNPLFNHAHGKCVPLLWFLYRDLARSTRIYRVFDQKTYTRTLRTNKRGMDHDMPQIEIILTKNVICGWSGLIYLKEWWITPLGKRPPRQFERFKGCSIYFRSSLIGLCEGRKNNTRKKSWNNKQRKRSLQLAIKGTTTFLVEMHHNSKGVSEFRFSNIIIITGSRFC